MKPYKVALCLLAAGALGACSNVARNFTVNDNRDTAHKLTPSADLFQQGLVEGYKGLGDRQYGYQDFYSADVFYSKAIAAGAGRDVPLENPDAWWLLDGDRAQIVAMRPQLMTRMASTKLSEPRATAAQQINFDCWVEELAEREYHSAEACKPILMVAQAPVPAPAPVATPAPAPAAAVPKQFVVFFDFDKSDITFQSQRVIGDAAAEWKKTGTMRITTTGHADRSGSDQYNQSLSERRAVAVRDALVRQGVPMANVAMIGRGESQPLVATDDGAREPQNRRVAIVF